MILFITNVTIKFDNNRHVNSRLLFPIPFFTILYEPVLTPFPVTLIENSASHYLTTTLCNIHTDRLKDIIRNLGGERGKPRDPDGLY